MPTPDGVPLRIVAHPTDPVLIADLERLVERARAGEIIGLAWCLFSTRHEIEHKFSAHFTADLFTAIGAVRVMEQDLLDLVDHS